MENISLSPVFRGVEKRLTPEGIRRLYSLPAFYCDEPSPVGTSLSGIVCVFPPD